MGRRFALRPERATSKMNVLIRPARTQLLRFDRNAEERFSEYFNAIAKSLGTRHQQQLEEHIQFSIREVSTVSDAVHPMIFPQPLPNCMNCQVKGIATSLIRDDFVRNV